MVQDYPHVLTACVKDIEAEADETTEVLLSQNEIRLLLALLEEKHDHSNFDLDAIMVLENIMGNLYAFLKEN